MYCMGGRWDRPNFTNAYTCKELGVCSGQQKLNTHSVNSCSILMVILRQQYDGIYACIQLVIDTIVVDLITQVGRYVLQVERILARHSDWSNKQNMVQLPRASTQKRLSLQSRRASWLAVVWYVSIGLQRQIVVIMMQRAAVEQLEQLGQQLASAVVVVMVGQLARCCVCLVCGRVRVYVNGHRAS